MIRHPGPAVTPRRGFPFMQLARFQCTAVLSSMAVRRPAAVDAHRIEAIAIKGRRISRSSAGSVHRLPPRVPD
jgi:hypothetical protein